MYYRFTNIVNVLKSLERTYTNHNLLNSYIFSQVLEAKVIIIQEAQDLKPLPLDHLLGSLIIYEKMLGDSQNKLNEEVAQNALCTQYCFRSLKKTNGIFIVVL